MSIQRIRDSLFVREAVESEIIRQILAAPIDLAGLDALEASISRQAAAGAAKELETTMRADEDFHRNLLLIGGFGGIWPIVAQARDLHQRTRAIAVPELQAGEQAVADHEAILAALRARNPVLAVQAMVAHLRRNETLTLQVAAMHKDYFDDHADYNH